RPQRLLVLDRDHLKIQQLRALLEEGMLHLAQLREYFHIDTAHLDSFEMQFRSLKRLLLKLTAPQRRTLVPLSHLTDLQRISAQLQQLGNNWLVQELGRTHCIDALWTEVLEPIVRKAEQLCPYCTHIVTTQISETTVAPSFQLEIGT